MKIPILSLIISLISMTNIANAQKHSKIIGRYTLSSNSQEGRTELFVLPNGDYAIAFFGGIQSGKWKKIKGEKYEFTPQYSEDTFEIYGRHNKDFKDSTRIDFKAYENGKTYIQVRASKKEDYTMQPLYNTGANCFSYPYTKTFNTRAKEISFMSSKYGEQAEDSSILTFDNPKGYNEFITNFTEVDRYQTRAMVLEFKNNELQMEDYKPATRRKIDEKSEDMLFIKKMIEQQACKDVLFFNQAKHLFDVFSGPDGKEILKTSYQFNKENKVYILKKNKEDILDDTLEMIEESYEDMTIIYPYIRLKLSERKSVKHSIGKKSVFQANCE